MTQKGNHLSSAATADISHKPAERGLVQPSRRISILMNPEQTKLKLSLGEAEGQGDSWGGHSAWVPAKNVSNAVALARDTPACERSSPVREEQKAS